MSGEKLPRLERLLEQTARRLSTAGLHPLHLRDRILEAFEAGVRDGDAPNDIRVGLHPQDLLRLKPELPAFRADMLQLLAERARIGGYRSLGERAIHLVSDMRASPGNPRITARFAHAPAEIPSVRSAANVTRRLFPVKDLALHLPGGETIPVTHLPFLIGRGPENDLVLASMAVSLHHAELTRGARGLVLRDMGSRNGIVVSGRRLEVVAISPGDTFTLGDVDLRLEQGTA